MEGNNEVDIDGRERALDYLGTEDSFTFSWGFQNTFAGLRAGMPFIGNGAPAMLSIYRFHDHLPIRFARELTWSIDWRHERIVHGPAEVGRASAGGRLLGGLRHGVLLVPGSSGGLPARAAAARRPSGD